MSALPKYLATPTHKECPTCKRTLPASEYYFDKNRSEHLRYACKSCSKDAQKNWNYKTGRHLHMEDNPSCPIYLGVHVAERLLSNIFPSVVRMPHGNIGYDFVCGKGYKIDVKSSCVSLHSRKYPCWTYKPNRNKIADYFACLAFDNRGSLNPIHFWLFPGNALSMKTTLTIMETRTAKWLQYEKPISQIVDGCNTMRSVDKQGLLTELMKRGVLE